MAGWFRDTFPAGPTEAQRLAWPRIAAGESVLLVSPTGTGKTLAAFLVALDELVREKVAKGEERRLRVLYVSPLKALDNDVHRNLDAPRAGIRKRLPDVRIEAAVRTGDTPQSARASQVKSPPDILITTPESIYLMLTGTSRRIFAGVTTVILDEVHSIAGTKRGAHLALTLERLDALVAAAGNPLPRRIALSATVEPPGRVAAFVGGTEHRVTPLVVKAPKRLELRVGSPLGESSEPQEGAAWRAAIDAIEDEIAKRRTTLVFCNNRRHAERIAALLSERLGLEVPTHHGSVSRALREEIEAKLKSGTLRVLVATGSLELGLDIGEIDAVVQVSSPKGVARALQRVGRSGHLVGETSRGRFLPLQVDDLFECAATVEGMNERDVEETKIPEFPLDVLAQQLVAEVVSRAGTGVSSDELLSICRRAGPYRNLPKSLFDETLAMLSGKYPKERFAELAPKLVWDRATGRVSPLPSARLAAILDGGTIADRGLYKVVLRDRKTIVGELDEEFVYETRVGDVFLLGSRSWRATDITHDRIAVEDSSGQPGRMPFWRGEGIGRTPRLGERIGRLKKLIADGLDDPALLDTLRERFGCDEGAGAALIGAVRREATEGGGVSSDTRVVFEAFPNELGDPCVVVRSVFGRGVNNPWSLALAGVLREETGVDIEALASDDGILLRAPRAEREIPLERLSRLSSAEAKERLLAQLPNSSMFGARFRENAQRALLLPRARAGKRTPFWLQRLKAKDLLQTTRDLPSFPIVAETYRDCLKDVWEYDRLQQLLDDLSTGKVERVLETRKFASPAAARLLFGFVAIYMYEWDAPKAEKGLHALALNRELLGEVLGETFDDGLRKEAADEARAEAGRTAPYRLARTADEMLRVFQELGDLTEDQARERSQSPFLAELLSRGSIVPATLGGEPRLVTAEERDLFASLDTSVLSRRTVLLRYFATRGPASLAEAANRYGLATALVEATVEELRDDGLVVSGRFGGDVRLFAGARLAETIRRKTLGILRREIQPVPAATFRRFLARRQGVELGARFTGPDAAERALSLLRGLSLPALAWEMSILPARLTEAEPDALELLSARGLLVWRAAGVKEPRAARLSFLFRGEGSLVLPEEPPDLEGLSTTARALHDELALAGASFVPDVAARIGKTAGEVDAALVELVLAGLVTGDGLHGLRELMRGAGAPDAAPPRPFGRHPGRATLHAAASRVESRLSSRVRSGRFSLLRTPGVMGEVARPGDRAEAWARLLVARWGVVSRDILEREDGASVRWSDVAPALSRLELRGDLRRGEFVEGNGPMQYAEEETVEALRSLRDQRSPESAGLAVVGGADPILVGVPIPTGPGDWLALLGGEPSLQLSAAGALTLSADVTDTVVRASLGAIQELLRRSRDPLARPRRLTISTVGDRKAISSAYAPLFESLGFTRERDGFGFRAL